MKNRTEQRRTCGSLCSPVVRLFHVFLQHLPLFVAHSVSLQKFQEVLQELLLGLLLSVMKQTPPTQQVTIEDKLTLAELLVFATYFVKVAVEC